MNRAFRLYNHGEIGDIDEVITHAIASEGLYNDIVLVGYSMGGNIHAEICGCSWTEKLPHGREKKPIAVSAPVNLETSAGLTRPARRTGSTATDL